MKLQHNLTSSLMWPEGSEGSKTLCCKW